MAFRYFATVDGRFIGQINELNFKRLQHRKGVEIRKEFVADEVLKAESRKQKAESRKQKAESKPTPLCLTVFRGRQFQSRQHVNH